MLDHHVFTVYGTWHCNRKCLVAPPPPLAASYIVHAIEKKDKSQTEKDGHEAGLHQDGRGPCGVQGGQGPG